MPLLRVRDLVKTYQVGDVAVRALRGVTADVEAGEFVAVVGPSGSGKSTFMHILGCLDRPTSGEYRLEDRDVSRLNDDELSAIRNRQIGFVFQGFNLLARTSAAENVELPLLYGPDRVSAAERRRRALAALDAVGLADRAEHHPNQLSGGQQQRVAIARALLNNPSILFADEPTGNLDSRTSIEVMDIFQRLKDERGITIVLITHEQQVAEYGSRIIAFKDGQIVSDQANRSAAAGGGRAGAAANRIAPHVHRIESQDCAPGARAQQAADGADHDRHDDRRRDRADDDRPRHRRRSGHRAAGSRRRHEPHRRHRRQLQDQDRGRRRRRRRSSGAS